MENFSKQNDSKIEKEIFISMRKCQKNDVHHEWQLTKLNDHEGHVMWFKAFKKWNMSM